MHFDFNSCFFKFWISPYFFSHFLHWWFFILLWVIKWSFKCDFRLNRFLHISQSYLLISVWIKLWRNKFELWENFFSHFLHWNGVSFVWTRTWLFKLKSPVNDLSHCLHLNTCLIFDDWILLGLKIEAGLFENKINFSKG